jgi:hypothetical protein
MGEEADLPDYQGPFPDVPSDEWYIGPVERAAELGTTTGYPDGTFRPIPIVSRAEMATLILRAIGEDSTYPASKAASPTPPKEHGSPPTRHGEGLALRPPDLDHLDPEVLAELRAWGW